MITKRDYTVNVVNGFGELKVSAPYGKIFFVRVSGPSAGWTVEIYTRDNPIYKYENAEKDTIVDQIEIPCMGELHIKVSGPDGAYTIGLGFEEVEIKNQTEYLYVTMTK